MRFSASCTKPATACTNKTCRPSTTARRWAARPRSASTNRSRPSGTTRPAGGGIGYFPTYTLGNLYAAQFMDQARRDVAGLDDDFRRGEFGRLKGWLNERVYRNGQRYRAAVLCERVTGRPLSHKPLLAYLQAKYEPLYG